MVLQQCVREDGFDSALSTRDLAGAVARVALSHYIFPDADPAVGRRQIRAAAGLLDVRIVPFGIEAQEDALTTSKVVFDPFSSDFFNAPFATYRRMRDEEPVYYSENYDFMR